MGFIYAYEAISAIINFKRPNHINNYALVRIHFEAMILFLYVIKFTNK